MEKIIKDFMLSYAGMVLWMPLIAGALPVWPESLVRLRTSVRQNIYLYARTANPYPPSTNAREMGTWQAGRLAGQHSNNCLLFSAWPGKFSLPRTDRDLYCLFRPSPRSLQK